MGRGITPGNSQFHRGGRSGRPRESWGGGQHSHPLRGDDLVRYGQSSRGRQILGGGRVREPQPQSRG